MKKSLAMVTLLAIVFTGCGYKYNRTAPQVKIDGTKTDYSKFDQFKKKEKCIGMGSGAIMSIVDLSKEAGISEIKHIDSRIEHTQFLWWHSFKECITIYGE